MQVSHRDDHAYYHKHEHKHAQGKREKGVPVLDLTGVSFTTHNERHYHVGKYHPQPSDQRHHHVVD